MTQTVTATFAENISDNQINITPTAKNKLTELLNDTDSDIDGIRVYVSGGGCSGMQYGLTFSEGKTQYDSVYEGDGFNLMIDAFALAYMQGCEIDFQEQGANASFVFNNVFQAVGGSGSCSGCGSS